MQTPYIDVHTYNLVGAPKKRPRPMMLLVPLLFSAAVAIGAFMILSLSLIMVS